MTGYGETKSTINKKPEGESKIEITSAKSSKDKSPKDKSKKEIIGDMKKQLSNACRYISRKKLIHPAQKKYCKYGHLSSLFLTKKWSEFPPSYSLICQLNNKS